MGQSLTCAAVRIFALALFALTMLAGCDSGVISPAEPADKSAVRIASLSPAATDLLIAMDAGPRLVGVSNYDAGREDAKHLPRVGDYQTIDWEKLAGLKPTVMVVQGRPERMPSGLQPRAASLGINVVNIQINNLGDIYAATTVLGNAMEAPANAQALVGSIRSKLDAVRDRVKEKPKVRTLIVVDTSGQYVAGHTTFLSDLLEIAGGENVVPKKSGPWPSLDREMLLSLKPDVILQLLPSATPQVMDKAKAAWPGLADLPAVKNGRVYQLTEWYIHQPGARVGDTAELFVDKLHP
jgi:iron complex transport system substrate-binding protein